VKVHTLHSGNGIDRIHTRSRGLLSNHDYDLGAAGVKSCTITLGACNQRLLWLFENYLMCIYQAGGDEASEQEMIMRL